MLFGQHPRGEGVFVVARQDRDARLAQDRPLVERRRDDVHRAAGLRRAGGDGAGVGVQALERGSVEGILQAVAVVEGVAKRHGTEALANAYLNYLYTPQAQDIEAQNGYRPRDPSILAKYSAKFPSITLFTIDDVFGGWQAAQKKHFADNGTFDQIYSGN